MAKTVERIIIMCGGLGDDMHVAFRPLVDPCDSEGYKVIYVTTRRIGCFADRVFEVIEAFDTQRRMHPQAEIFLVGQSSGGLAVFCAAQKMQTDGPVKNLKGVVMLSAALPRGYIFLTWTLLLRMIPRLGDLVRGRIIAPTEAEYASLVEPLLEHAHNEVVGARQSFSGVEARELALGPRVQGGAFGYMGHFHAPILYMYGDRDAWIAPRAQRRHADWLEDNHHTGDVFTHVVHGAGHCTLHSRDRVRTIGLIMKFVRDPQFAWMNR